VQRSRDRGKCVNARNSLRQKWRFKCVRLPLVMETTSDLPVTLSYTSNNTQHSTCNPCIGMECIPIDYMERPHTPHPTPTVQRTFIKYMQRQCVLVFGCLDVCVCIVVGVKFSLSEWLSRLIRSTFFFSVCFRWLNATNFRIHEFLQNEIPDP
jgi:hypothetical protein